MQALPGQPAPPPPPAGSYPSEKAKLEAAIEYAKSLPDLERINLAVVLTNKEARLLFVAHGFQSYGTERKALKLHDRYFDQGRG